MHFILCISKMVIRSLSIFPSFHPLHPMASNPAHVQGMISPQEGRGGARWSCNRAGGGFSYSTDAAGSWSKMALGSPLNLIEISYQWKKMKHNKWNFKGCPPSGQKPEVLMSYFLSLIYVVECFGENWAKPLQPKKFTSGEISGISLISRLNHSRPNFWSAGDPGIHILSYIIIYYHILSYTIIYYHILSYNIIFIYVYSDDIRIHNTISINFSLLSLEGVILIVYV